ncbi:MAG TPA: HAMP domain-containing sensor histidine kinase [Thermoanaerobaculia bacterium]|nr:HAMP domain-containing sensor histidine kinase [Thermoanaerobaculia bacterium]
MIQKFRQLLRFPYLWVWDHAIPFATSLVAIVICYGIHQADKNIRGELRLTVLQASNDIGHLFRAYEATEHFSDREVLQLCTYEMETVASSWTSVSSRLSLQGLGVTSALLYDSEDNTIRSYGTTSVIPRPSRIWRRITPHFMKEPLYTASQNVADKWTLRTVITGGNYLREQGKHFALTTLPLSLGILALFFFPTYYRTVLTFRHFETVIDTLLDIPLERRTLEEFMILLPQLVRTALHFDSCAVYLAKDDALVLEASSGMNLRADQSTIPCGSHSVEARTFRRNLMSVSNHPKGIPSAETTTTMTSSASSASVSYVAVPIVDPQDDEVIGVVAAEKAHGFEASNSTELQTLVRLVMVLFDQARATLRLKETYSRTIRQTRQVALGTVVPVIAHNLRHPISMVAMYAKDLAEKWMNLDREAIEKQLKQVEEQMNQCYALIERLLAYRMIGVHTEPNENSLPVDLCDVIAKTCDFFEAYFEIREIRLDSHFEENFRPRVDIDELDLVQVVSNLFINSYEAFRDAQLQGPACHVSISVTRSTHSHGVRIRISDNGPGVPPELRNRIFLSNVTTKAEGTGAGLPYCLEVIRHAGGKLELDPDVCAGATFNIDLPM